jgi:hypothetical protein
MGTPSPPPLRVSARSLMATPFRTHPVARLPSALGPNFQRPSPSLTLWTSDPEGPERPERSNRARSDVFSFPVKRVANSHAPTSGKQGSTCQPRATEARGNFITVGLRVKRKSAILRDSLPRPPLAGARGYGNLSGPKDLGGPSDHATRWRHARPR